MKRLLLVAIVVLGCAGATPAQSTHSNALSWGASTSTGATYNVYKDHGCAGAFVKLTTAPIAALTYTDAGMADGEVNCYLVTAAVGAGESAQAESTVVRAVTPTVTPGQAAVAPPGALKNVAQ
jgi:hypothetical protein